MKSNTFGLPKKDRAQVSVLLCGNELSRVPGYRLVRFLGGIFKVATILLWVLAGIFALLALLGR